MDISATAADVDTRKQIKAVWKPALTNIRYYLIEWCLDVCLSNRVPL